LLKEKRKNNRKQITRFSLGVVLLRRTVPRYGESPLIAIKRPPGTAQQTADISAFSAACRVRVSGELISSTAHVEIQKQPLQ